MPDEDRLERRARAHAKVLLLEGGIPGYLRDLSPRGCRVSLVKPAPAGNTLPLRVIPAEESGIPPFMVTLEVRWSREDPVFRQVGGLIHLPEDRQTAQSLDRLYAYYEETAS